MIINIGSTIPICIIGMTYMIGMISMKCVICMIREVSGRLLGKGIGRLASGLKYFGNSQNTS